MLNYCYVYVTIGFDFIEDWKMYVVEKMPMEIIVLEK